MQAARDLLRRQLPPRLYRILRSGWWHGSFFVPRLIGSLVIRRQPEVHGESSALLRDVKSVNVFRPTRMCRTMTRHGSDKGAGWHNYTTIYSALCRGLHSKTLRIFELGLGTNNPAWAFNMGAHGRPGASLRGWRDLFPQALIFGADIDRDCLFTEARIQTFYCDQLDPAAIHALWSEPALNGGMDIVIDDGLHTFAGNASFLDHSLKYLRPGGLYVVEDITTADAERWRQELPSRTREHPGYDFVLARLPNAANTVDNNLLVIRRHGSAG